MNPGETVTIDAGKNIKLTQAAGKVTVATTDDVTFDNVTADTVNVGGNTVNGDAITVDGKPVTSINEAINKTAEQAFKPLTFAGDTGANFDRKLGTQVNVKGGATGELSDGNIAVVSNGSDTLTVKLAKDLKDINSITVNEGPTINANGINMNGDQITNLKDNLPDTNDSTTNRAKPSDVNGHNAATVNDVLNAGWNIQGNGEAKDFVKPYDTVNFANGAGTTATVTSDGTISTVKYDVKVDNQTIKVGDDGNLTVITDNLPKTKDTVTVVQSEDKSVTVAKKANDADGNTVYDVAVAKATLTPNEDGTVKNTNPESNKNSFVTGDDVVNAINKSGFTLTTSKSAGEAEGTTKELVNPGETVTIDAGKNIKLTQAAGKVTVATTDDVTFDNVTAKTINVGSNTLNGDPIKVDGSSVTNVNEAITKTAEQAFKPLTFAGDTGANFDRKLGTQVNVKGGATGELSDGNIAVVSNGSDTLTVKLAKDLKDINSITVNEGPTINANGINMNGDQITNLKDNLPDTNDSTTNRAKPSDVNGHNAATVNDVLNAGWNIQGNGEAKDFVKPYDTVNFANGAGTTATVTSDGTISTVKYDVKVDNQTIKVGDDGNLTVITDNLPKTKDTVTVVQSEDKSVTVAKKANDADGNTVYDVAVAKATLTPNEDGTVKNTNPESNKNSFVTGDDVVNAINKSGFTLTTSKSAGEAEGTTEELVNPGETVTIDAGKNIKVTQAGNKITVATTDQMVLGEKGADGKNGVDGSIGVNGADGSGVAINGKDGSIGLKGTDGKDGLNLTPEAIVFNGVDGKDGKDGQVSMKFEKVAPALDGKDGQNGEGNQTRIVYTKPNGAKEEVATLNDGLNFTGNNEDTVNSHKLNTLVKVQGEGVDKAASESFKSAAGNINVKADGSNKLEIQLNKDINLGKDGSVTTGDTAINDNGLTITGGPSVTKDGIDAGNKKITNVAAGKDDTDAVNVKQLKDSRTTVKSSDNSISVDKTETADGNLDYDIKVNNQAVVENAQLPVVYTNKEGDKVYLVTDKDGNKTFNTKPDGSGDTVDNGDVIASMNNADGSTTAPTNLANVKGNLKPTYNTGDMTVGEDGKPTAAAATKPTKSQEAPTPEDAAKMYNNAATVGDVLNAGWNIQGNGEAKDFVKPYDTVNFVDGQGTTAVVTTDEKGEKTDVTFNVNVDGKTTEYTYVTKNGDTVYKHTDGNYYTQPNGEGDKVDTAGNPVTTQVSAKTGAIQYNDGDVNNTGNTPTVGKGKVAPKAGDEDKVTTVQNIADAINASGFTLTTSKSAGEAEGTTEELVNPGETVTIDAGKNIKVTQAGNKITVATTDQMVLGEKGADGKNGVDGSIGVNGADGSGVAINGKDGSIGLKGTDGKDGLNLTPEAIVFNGVDGKDGKDGQVSMKFEKVAPALDGKDGQNGEGNQTRIVYTKPNGAKEEVATLNDGLNFTGNNEDTVNSHKLNTLVKVQGEGVDKAASESFKSAAGNINVKADGSNKLEIQLNKDINLGKDGSVTTGDTAINDNGLTITGGPSVTKDGIDAGNKKITNVAAGKDDTDAVNVKQLKDSRTTVKSSDNSISVDKTETADGNLDYDIKVNNQAVVENAQLPVVYTNKEGDKVYLVTDKDGNKTFNTKPDGSGDTVDNGDVIASMNNADGSTTAPTNLANVKGNLKPTYNTGDMTVGEDGKPTAAAATKPTKSQEAPAPEDAAKMYNNAATVGDVLNAGWNIQGNGEAKDFVKPYDTVNFVDGQGTTAVVTTDEKGGRTDVTFNVNVDGKTTEYTYVTKNGDTVYKHTDGNYYTRPNGEGDKVDTAGNPVTTQVSAKTGAIQYNDGDVNNTGNTPTVGKGKVAPKAGDEDKVTTVQNIADAINASGFTLTTSKSAGEAEGTTEELVNPGETVTIDAGKNIKVTQAGNKITVATTDQMVLGEKGTDGKNGVDGSIGVNGADGSGVAINGKDGSVGLKGTDGKDGLNLTPEAIVFNGVDGKDGKDGQVSMKFEKVAPALDGKDGQNGEGNQTRIVYTKPNGAKEEVATLNDGLNFTGNNEDTVNSHKLNTLVKVQGEGVDKAASESFKSAAGNINVKADGKDTLTIQLNKDVKGLNSLQATAVNAGTVNADTVKAGDTTVNNKGVTINNGAAGSPVTLTKDGLNNGGNRITNVAPGVGDTDAVNVSQLKASNANVHNRIDGVENNANAGVAQAMATAGLPQAYLPGKSMMAIGGGVYRGETGYAIGFSSISDGGNWIVKGTASGNSRGNYGATAAVGYQW
ncbi:YadA-like family protein [Neisseria yangbaofengii]|uniref:YadA-like family protein n=2 Tax=Neisseria yangbaofengii TaxID=2709396 RepID=UPI003B9DD406